MSGAISLSPSVAASSATDQRQQLAHAAKQFEAIFLRQMLAAARSTDFGGNDLFGSSSEEAFTEMRDAHFADLASETGAFGMADAIEAQLTRLTGPEK
ncbi:flagellar biosynthesis protein FlgJ [Altererythrobacter xixiisoli]|uniref:Flagellar biosynthesis protein FlgJ n=1 Tax=Croceibacterium xixiisoli TaxID=1476466 RepID=A0A6I4TTC8_9SPHN|nr:rod-binding protein [Croceibacterium xixiisoli]MXO98470.1 flagellar biosynthesis protein FlgJ [Croceibacterium xixiisoli]